MSSQVESKDNVHYLLSLIRNTRLQGNKTPFPTFIYWKQRMNVVHWKGSGVMLELVTDMQFGLLAPLGPKSNWSIHEFSYCSLTTHAAWCPWAGNVSSTTHPGRETTLNAKAPQMPFKDFFISSLVLNKEICTCISKRKNLGNVSEAIREHHRMFIPSWTNVI